MNSINALDLAEFILATYPQHSITPMKLQKLAWYAKVWTLVSGDECVNASFKKWNFGPVNTEIFHKYKSYSKVAIPAPENPPKLIQESTELLTFILDNYVNLTAVALSNMTHKEDPWKDTPQDQLITDSVIIDYYSKQSFAKNFQGKKFNEGKFWVLKTNSWHSFTMDMDKDEADAHEVFDSYADYLEEKEEADKLVMNIWNMPISDLS